MVENRKMSLILVPWQQWSRRGANYVGDLAGYNKHQKEFVPLLTFRAIGAKKKLIA